MTLAVVIRCDKHPSGTFHFACGAPERPGEARGTILTGAMRLSRRLAHIEFFGAVRPLRRLFPGHPALKVCQDTRTQLAEGLHFNVSVSGSDVLNHIDGASACPTKEFPKPERIFPRLK